MRSKSQQRSGQSSGEKSLDYISLLRDHNFDFYGIFAYLKLTFDNDKLMGEILQQPQPQLTNEDNERAVPQYVQLISRLYKEEEHTYNPLIAFSTQLYSRSFTHDNIIEFSEDEVRIKLCLCKNFIKQHPSVNFKQTYFYMLAIRCLLHQPTDIDACEKLMTKRLYPWVAFETFHMKGKKGEFSVLLFNFLENTISETQKGILSSSIPFAKLNKVTYGYTQDELIVTVDNQLIVYRAKYPFQRSFIAETFRFSISCDMNVKVKSHYINPNESDFQNRIKKQQEEHKLAQEGYFKLIDNDRLVPPKAIITYRGRILSEGELAQKDKPMTDFTYISLGMNHIILHNNSHGIKFCNMIPFNCDCFYLEITPEPKYLGFHVGSQRNFAYFQTELEVTNFREALQAVMHKKIFLDSYFLHFPSEKSSKHLLRFKKFKLREVYKKIDESKKILEYYQGIKHWLEIQVMQSELDAHSLSNSQIPSQMPSQIRSSTPNIRQTESKFIEKSNPPLNSPTFAKKLNLTKTREPRLNENVDDLSRVLRRNDTSNFMQP